MPAEFADFRHVHLIGIKGAGMTGLAEILQRQGVRVTGSDTEERFFTDAVLERLGIVPLVGFSAEHLPAKAEAFIYSTAYAPETNPELRAAFDSGKPVMSYPEAVGHLTRGSLALCVAGSHGKTTTAAMLAVALEAAGTRPTALLGSRVREWGGNALVGAGSYFVLEADEYQDKLSHYQPFGILLTNVDWDHPDYFPDTQSYEAVFERFIERLPAAGHLVVCGDHARALAVSEAKAGQRLRYGLVEDNDYRIVGRTVLDPREAGGALQRFTLLRGEEPLGEFRLSVPGEHNAVNAAGVMALCHDLKLDLGAVGEALARFPGVERRFELIGQRDGVLVYDDYAHHPAEILATLRAAREHFPEHPLRVVFHPHTYSRTATFLQEFAQSFDLADSTIVLDVYGSAREEAGSVSSADLVRLMNTYRPGTAVHIPRAEEAVVRLREEARPGDVVVTLGAGSVWEVGRSFLKR